MTALKDYFKQFAPLPPEAAPSGQYDIGIIGSGMGSLSAAVLLAKKGLKVAVLEQNYLPGGCSSAYWRKGFVFESGATTLVGLDEHMPVRHLLNETGIVLKGIQKLALPMKVHLPNGDCVHRHQSLEAWIAEAERAFGPKGQRDFWLRCKQISDFVWETSLKQTAFPPTSFGDLVKCASRSSLRQVQFARHAFFSMKHLLKAHGLLENTLFVDFVNEQLKITAQNTLEEVNVLFGATALCYTNYGNYYIEGGLIHLVQPFIDYLQSQGGEMWLRTSVQGISKLHGHYALHTDRGHFYCKKVISGIPINNTLPLLQGNWGTTIKNRFSPKIMPSEKLNSAFQIGMAFKGLLPEKEALHHQIHLEKPLPEIGKGSIFLSMSPAGDRLRSDLAEHTVASVSTHVHDPARTFLRNKEAATEAVFRRLEEVGLIEQKNIVYHHASTPGGWEQWTKREWGFVGGYPQYMQVKPWQMLPARLDGQGLFLCGDTAYPGQGIPGVALSGIIAAEAAG